MLCIRLEQKCPTSHATDRVELPTNVAADGLPGQGVEVCSVHRA